MQLIKVIIRGSWHEEGVSIAEVIQLLKQRIDNARQENAADANHRFSEVIYFLLVGKD